MSRQRAAGASPTRPARWPALLLTLATMGAFAAECEAATAKATEPRAAAVTPSAAAKTKDGGAAAATAVRTDARSVNLSAALEATLATTALAIDSAVRLQAIGKLNDATRLLGKQRTACEAGAAGASCRVAVDYSTGYVLQRSSMGTGSSDQLRQAVSAYERVLRENPTHLPTLENLARAAVQLGDPRRAAELLQRAVERQPATAGKLGVLLGDVLLDAGEPVRARQAYEKAAALAVSTEVALARVVFSYETAPSPAAAQELLQRAAQWEKTSPAAASEAYTAAIRLALAAGKTEVAERALVDLVALVARSSELQLSELASLPAKGAPPAFGALRAFLEHPEAPLAADSWWRLADARREALARLALGVGKQRLAAGDAAAAAAIWRRALELVPYGGAANVDLKAELALLFHRHRELDPDGAALAEMEETLFDGKQAALANGDLPSQQRFHTALGLVYADLGRWDGTPSWRGAVYQLDHAIRAAAQREARGETYQPLPWVRRRLGDCQVATNAPLKAAASYLDAARDYLDLDDLQQAERMLGLAGELGGEQAEVAAEVARLRDLLHTRQALRTALAAAGGGEPGAGGEDAGGDLEALAGAAWLQASGTDTRHASFLLRQRFKALADLAQLQSRHGAPASVTLRAALQPLAMAVDRQVVLTGASDLLRLERLQALAGMPLGLTPERPRVEPARGKEPRGVPLTLGSGSDPTTALLPNETLAAVRLYRQLGIEGILAAGLRLGVNDEVVSVKTVNAGVDVGTIEKLLN